MDKYELHQKAHDMAQGTTQYALARELVKARERIAELERDNAAMSESFNLLVNAVEEDDSGFVGIDFQENPRVAAALMDDIGPGCVGALARRDKLVAAEEAARIARKLSMQAEDAEEDGDESARDALESACVFAAEEVNRLRREAEENEK